LERLAAVRKVSFCSFGEFFAGFLLSLSSPSLSVIRTLAGARERREGGSAMKRLMMVIILLSMMVVGAGLAMADDNAASAGSFTCSGGTATSPTIIPAGTYTQVTVTGICRILGAVTGPKIGPDTGVIKNCNARGGPVNVLGGLTIAPNGFLDAGSCAPTVNVSGGVAVGSGGGLILGCSPFLVVAPPAPPFPSLCPGITTSNVIKRGVTAPSPWR
jgi:hypothetical protein